MTLNDIRDTVEVGDEIVVDESDPDWIRELEQPELSEESDAKVEAAVGRFLAVVSRMAEEDVDPELLGEFIEEVKAYTVIEVEGYYARAGLAECSVEGCDRLAPEEGGMCFSHWRWKFVAPDREEWTMDEMTFLSLPRESILKHRTLRDGRKEAVVDLRKVEKWLNEVE